MAAVRILLVEDNEDNRDLTTRMLSFYGFQVVTAATAEEGLVLAREVQPHLVLMDISLPGMDGVEATRRLRQDPRTAHIPVVALTAHAMKGDRERFLEAGCNDYLSKPFAPDQLLEVVRRNLRGRVEG